MVVAAFDPDLPGGGFPASLPGVVSAAEESLLSLPGRVYRAPGRDIPTTQPGGRWYLVNGNSFAAAHVTGLLALLREERGSCCFCGQDRAAADGTSTRAPRWFASAAMPLHVRPRETVGRS
jgi:hypothetical protein